MVASPYPSNWISTWSWQGQPVGVVAAPAQEQAEAAPVVLIHGFGACKEHWRHNVEALRRERAVYALDLIGFGASSQPGARLDNRLWARQLQRFLEEVVQRPAVLVGHSLGALVVLSCAVFFPKHVLAVVAAVARRRHSRCRPRRRSSCTGASSSSPRRR
jgi:pimeloyl-ACP methyl ester carboxylesterase